MNVLFTCGGTAGHVNPAVALAHIFQERHPGCRVLFVGADGGMENKLVPKEGYQIRTVTITNFHRSFKPADIAHNFGTLVNMGRSKKQARAILNEFSPTWWWAPGATHPSPWSTRRPTGAFPPPSTSPTPSLD